MPNIFEIKIHCATGKGSYIAVFEEQNKGEWVGVRARPMPKASFIEMILGSDPRKAINSKVNVSGAFYYGTLKCPICGNQSFVKCNTCGCLTCLPVNGTYFQCRAGRCKNGGNISGSITDLSGTTKND